MKDLQDPVHEKQASSIWLTIQEFPSSSKLEENTRISLLVFSEISQLESPSQWELSELLLPFVLLKYSHITTHCEINFSYLNLLI